MKIMKIGFVLLLVTVAACGRTSLTVDTVQVAPPVAHDDASVPDAIVRTDTQVVFDLLPTKNDAFVADTTPVKTDAGFADTMTVGTPDAVIVKLDTATPDTYAAKQDALGAETNPAKTDALVIKADALPTPDLAPVKTDTKPSGVLSIRLADDTPASMIMNANTTDNTATRILFVAVNEGFSVTRLTIENVVTYSSRSITSARLFDKNGILFCSGALDSKGRLRCANDAGLFSVDGTQEISIKVNIDQDGAGNIGANSGDAIQMALYVDKTGGYTDDFKAVGVTSGITYDDAVVRDSADISTTPSFGDAPVQIIPDTYGTVDLVSGYTHVIRKSQPTVSTIALSQTLTSNPSLYKFFQTAAVNSDIGLKRFNLDITNVGVTLGAFRVYENDVLLDPSLYRVCYNGSVNKDVLSCTVDLYADGKLPQNALSTVMVYFYNERITSAGTTKTYRLDATATGVTVGNSVVTKLKDDAAASINTANLEDSTLDTVNFVWSDTSSDTHSAVHGMSSSDWTNGKFVKSLPTNAQYVGL